MGFLSKLLGRTVPNAPEMFRNVSRGTDARLSGSTPGPAVVNAGMGNYFEALRQSKDRTQPTYMAAATASGRIFGGLNRKQLAALGRYLVDNHDLEMICRRLESLRQRLAPRFIADVRLPSKWVTRGASHYDLYCPLVIGVVMPRGSQLSQLVVKLHADAATHANDHCLAVPPPQSDRCHQRCRSTNPVFLTGAGPTSLHRASKKPPLLPAVTNRAACICDGTESSIGRALLLDPIRSAEMRRRREFSRR